MSGRLHSVKCRHEAARMLSPETQEAAIRGPGGRTLSFMDREEAWDAVHEALPARWAVGLPSQHPSSMTWSITARGPHPGRGKHPQTVTGSGEDETAALRDLDDRLRGSAMPVGRMDDLRARLRLAYVAGAEEWTRGDLGRGMTREELDGIVTRFEGRQGAKPMHLEHSTGQACVLGAGHPGVSQSKPPRSEVR
jgi:hypothetical protein